jgi:paraquat-inducible protein B
MSAKANYFKLGLFIIVTVLLGLGAVLVFGASKLFERKLVLETYFDQSVQGVDVGSKVKFRGVDVGRIRRIDFTRNHYEQAKPRTERRSYVRVEVEMASGALGGMAEGIVRENLEKEIEKGLRVRLTALGLTGTSYLEVDYLHPTRYEALEVEWVPRYPYVPSAPSAFTRIVSSLEDLVGELDRIEFQSLAGKADRLLDRATQTVEALDAARISAGLMALRSEAGDSNRRLQDWLDRPELEGTLTDAATAMSNLRQATSNPALTNSVVQLERSLRRLDALLAGKDEPLQASLESLGVASENLRELTETARQYPAQVLFGEPPPPVHRVP